ncbi:circularly permuted type 2 ATP-grasp protein [Undibacterium sp. LX40W]|uniref:Circularly permuted type 2 ATP-grasp protein n=2 Tax=Oxalobacteraceae TaxID=75682 RepID=A0A923KSV4_9BURK|nr:circularly permuted type 2 ATP-grasp protein [Undibacterium nitidum]MBC3891606.1 circularly permuted type 2 ATP-grasp protein [Undibacterium sp. LX40W]
MLEPSRAPRAHWRRLMESLAQEPEGVMQQRAAIVQRKVRENGVTYNVYDDTKGMQRPWDLNVLPMILPHEEWEEIEAAVVQRATLLNRILIDIYGEQSLLAEAALPAALVHGNAGFLRPCHGIEHLDEIALHFYAVDLARAPNGQWWVVGDRTQAPSGAGYSLENRFVIASAFPELFREMKVRHLAGFFSTMLESMTHWGRMCANGGTSAPNGQRTLAENEDPLIVLLTPGPYNETYHEQSFLARYLGVPLVEGSDLTVRDGMVWLKALSGLQRVHVIMRRVDDEFSDPLELRSDSALGIAGLTDVARRGNVVIANSLGSNLLESGALLGFLPSLSEKILGEELKMPSVGTWWCGEPAALEEVIARLDQLIVKPSFPQLRQYPVFGKDLKGSARAEFIKKMRAHPENFVAQELVHLSQAPIWRAQVAEQVRTKNDNPVAESSKPSQPLKNSLTASAIGLRVYACATPSGYVVMPGGLTRVATGPDDRVLAMQRGGGSKDTWVLANPQAEPESMVRKQPNAKDLIRDDTHLSSRVAENLYWFGRYCERCDNIARLMRTAIVQMITMPAEMRRDEWQTIQALCAWSYLITLPAIETEAQSQSQTQSGIPSQSQSPQSNTPATVPILSDQQLESELMLAMVSPSLPGIANQLQNLYRIASQLRERVSLDNWRTINQMMQRFGNGETPPTISEASLMLDEAISDLMNLTGFALDGMTRDKGWRFLSIGRRIERLQFICALLQHGLAMRANSKLDWLLETADSIVTYRSRYMARPEWMSVLDLLLLDESNPRSVVFQLEGILTYLSKLARSYGACGTELLAPLLQELLVLDPAHDFYAGNPALIDLLGRISRASAEVSDRLSVRFFSYTGVSPNLDKPGAASGSSVMGTSS